MINSFYFVIAYIIILFVLSAFLIKKALNSFEEYGYCGRSLSIGFVLFTYLGTWIGGGTIIGLVGRSYEYGASQYWIIAMSCIVELFFALFFIGKIRKLGLKSITGFFAMRYPEYREAVRIPVAAALLIRNVTMIAMQFSALSYLITFVFGINWNLALLLVFLVVISYTVLSGLWGVAVTDVFQGILQTVGLVILIVISLKFAGGIHAVESFYHMEGSLKNLSLFATDMQWYEILLYIAAFGLFFLMNDQTNWERIYASKGEKTARWGFMIPLVITLIMLVMITYLGVFQRAIFSGAEDAGAILYNFIFNMANSKWIFLILVGLLAAIMSSADSFLLASGILVSEDIIKRFIIKDADDKELIFFTRVFVVVTGAVAFAFAINISDILYLWLTGIGMTSVILVPGYFLGWFTKRSSTRGILLGMLAGSLYVAAIAVGLIEAGPLEICVGMALNLLISCVFSLPGSKDAACGPDLRKETLYKRA
ncbi:sodium:solute symporter family protein [bacterium 210820-DFI.6.37]|nr:sodium:solute symporter family protein [bacterium 210820-DFI.6.37]